MCFAELAAALEWSLAGVQLPDTPAGNMLVNAVAAIQRTKDYSTALGLLNQAIAGGAEVELGQAAFLLYDLRAACRFCSEDFKGALADAELCTKMKGSWPRGWARRGAALLCLGRCKEALAAYDDAAGWSRGQGAGSPSEEIAQGLALARVLLDDSQGLY